MFLFVVVYQALAREEAEKAAREVKMEREKIASFSAVYLSSFQLFAPFCCTLVCIAFIEKNSTAA